MQDAVLPKPSTLSNLDSSTVEASSVMVEICTMNDDIRPPANLSTTGVNTNSKKARCDSFYRTMLSQKCRKACEDIFLVLATVATVCVCTLPTVVYFAAMVSE